MQFQIISCKTLDTLLKKSNYLLIDLREKQDYEVSHIPNAIWYNWEKLEKEIDTLLNQLTYFHNGSFYIVITETPVCLLHEIWLETVIR